MDWRILTKFGMLMHLGPLDPPANKICEFLKFKMAAAAILKNQKSQSLRNELTDFDNIWHDDASPPGPCQPMKFDVHSCLSMAVHCSLYKKAWPKKQGSTTRR